MNHNQNHSQSVEVNEVEVENDKFIAFMNKKYESMPTVSNPEVIRLLNIGEADLPFLRIFDQLENGLQLIHYIRAESATPKALLLRGIIIATHEHPIRIVCQSFPFTPELLLKDYTPSNDEVKDSQYMPSYEGTILRVFSYRGEWFLSTHKKINAKNSRWNSPTFGTLFTECWGSEILGPEGLDSVLNPMLCYVFMMSHPQNSLVCRNEKAVLYHIVSYTSYACLIPEEGFEGNDVPKFVPVQVMTDCTEAFPIKHPNVLIPVTLKFFTLEQVQDFVNVQVPWQTFSGLICTNAAGMVKILNEEYQHRREIRGNEPNLRIQFFALKAKNLQQELVELLPNQKSFFDKCESDRQRLVYYLYQYFEFRELNKNYLRVPQEEHRFLERVKAGTNLFGLAPTDIEETVKTTIRNMLQQSSPRELNAMIKHMTLTDGVVTHVDVA